VPSENPQAEAAPTDPALVPPNVATPPTAEAGRALTTNPAMPPATPPTQSRTTVPPPPEGADPAAAQPTTPVRPVLPSGVPTGGISVPEQRGTELRGARFSRSDGPEDLASKRVRVVLAERKGVARPVRTVVDIQEGTGVGELLRINLIGSQLAVALRFAIGAGLTLGLLPLLFAMFPEIGRIDVLGIRLPWLLLGVLVYPFLFGLGLWHTRTAEYVEKNFADHVQD
jgi:hypothetical protein